MDWYFSYHLSHRHQYARYQFFRYFDSIVLYHTGIILFATGYRSGEFIWFDLVCHLALKASDPICSNPTCTPLGPHSIITTVAYTDRLPAVRVNLLFTNVFFDVRMLGTFDHRALQTEFEREVYVANFSTSLWSRWCSLVLLVLQYRSAWLLYLSFIDIVLKLALYPMCLIRIFGPPWLMLPPLPISY